jgi:7-carboxy-7-deazaguanine synthase
MKAAGPRLPVVEIFGPTLQGEGRQIGLRTMFVRLAGCDWACVWCDTAFAWKPGVRVPAEALDPADILERLVRLDPVTRRVTLTGGNPALHDAGPLVEVLHGAGYRVHVETQGSLAPAWLGQVDSVTVSPKGPSSGMPPDWEGLRRTLAVAADPDLKVVVFDESDLDYAREVRRRYPVLPFTLQLGNRVGEDDEASLLRRLRWLAEAALGDPAFADVRVLPQLHVLLWGNRRGV